MLTKEAVNNQIKELPDEFTLDDRIEKLLIIDKVNRGLLDVEEGRIVSETELDKRMAKWFS
jgi:predicted transcriptional regulator